MFFMDACFVLFFLIFFFFFKQKTAYEMRISDWSSDVCSSDLIFVGHPAERIAEVPTFYELVQGTVQQFVPLDVQRSWTAEVGSRGSAGPVSWDVSAYRAWVRGELLAYTVNPDVPASTFNAHKTLHQGVEALLELRLAAGLRFRQIYNYSDFRFRNDSQYGEHRLPVVPAHQLRSEPRPEGT